MNSLRKAAYRLDPVLWVRDVLGVEPTAWQAEYLRAPLGSSILALTARQAGKTTTAAWAIAHFMLFTPGGLCVIACPAQRQSAEAVRRIREILIKLGLELKVDNIYGLELTNGARVLALPGSDDSIRGMTVDGWIVADEAARLDNDVISALRPMRARRPEARFAMLSTAWSRTDPFWTAWASEDPSWLRLKATADQPGLYSPEYLQRERCALGEAAFNREYLGIPGGAVTSPFDWSLYERATEIHVPLVQRGNGRPPLHDVNSWPGFKPVIIAHDVGRSRDRSTAVIGGGSPYDEPVLGIRDIHELPQGLFGSARAAALAEIDRQYHRIGLIVADVSFDPTYAEVLHETFGSRVVGLQIGRNGDGMTFERRQVKHGSVLVYSIGRSYLLELLHSHLQSDQVLFAAGAATRRAYEQLANLELELRDSGKIYRCPPGLHDDLGISCAMLTWAANHPHLPNWSRVALPVKRSVGPRITAAEAWRATT